MVPATALIRIHSIPSPPQDSSQRIVFDGNAVWSLGADSQGDGFSTFSNPEVRRRGKY